MQNTTYGLFHVELRGAQDRSWEDTQIVVYSIFRYQSRMFESPLF